MAHGFLTPTPVSGDNFLKNAKWLYGQADKRLGITDKLKAGLNDLLSKFGKKSGLIHVERGPVYQAQKTGVDEVSVTDVTQKPAARMLKAAAPALLGQGSNAITKSETPALPSGSPKLPGKGGSFINVPATAGQPAGLNAETFFKQALTGTGSSGEYLSTEQRKNLFAKSREMRASENGPEISKDSGVDIVAAVNQVTSAILNLQSIQQQSTTTNVKELARLRSALEEQQMELGGDYSGFLTPENFKKRDMSGRCSGVKSLLRNA